MIKKLDFKQNTTNYFQLMKMIKKMYQKIGQFCGRVHGIYVRSLRNNSGTKNGVPQVHCKYYKNKTLTKWSICGNITELKMVFRKLKINILRDLSVIVP